jgi:hypothetical protein
MYMLFKNNRPVSNIKYPTYEKCRQWARRLARKSTQRGFSKLGGMVDMSDVLWRTPSLDMYGYSIRKV